MAQATINFRIPFRDFLIAIEQLTSNQKEILQQRLAIKKIQNWEERFNILVNQSQQDFKQWCKKKKIDYKSLTENDVLKIIKKI